MRGSRLFCCFCCGGGVPMRRCPKERPHSVLARANATCRDFSDSRHTDNMRVFAALAAAGCGIAATVATDADARPMRHRQHGLRLLQTATHGDVADTANVTQVGRSAIWLTSRLIFACLLGVCCSWTSP